VPVLASEDAPEVELQIVDLRSASAHPHANGHARDHANGHANGAASRRRDEFGIGEVATFLSAPLVSTGFAAGASAPTAVAIPMRPAAAPAIPTLPSGLYARFGKRALDIAAGVLSLVIAGPIVLLAALAVKLTSRGPAFYKSTRLGKDGRPFTFYKLRSMYVGADAERARLMHLNEVDGPVFKLRRDPRVTRVGQWLRSSSGDELPQLLNVLKGDMSLVGPRPERPEFVSGLTEQIPFYGQRHAVRPGLTGWAQVRFPYGASVEDSMEKLQYDLYYIKNRSIALDFYIIFETLKTVLTRGGS
jgi:lipopolysaccharide/colanic/teichoic acid biosynthesis glycosyltransferase